MLADIGRLDADTDVVSRLPPPVAAAGLGARRGLAAAGRAVRVDPGLTALGFSTCSYDAIIRLKVLLTISTCAATKEGAARRVSRGAMALRGGISERRGRVSE